MATLPFLGENTSRTAQFINASRRHCRIASVKLHGTDRGWRYNGNGRWIENGRRLPTAAAIEEMYYDALIRARNIQAGA